MTTKTFKALDITMLAAEFCQTSTKALCFCDQGRHDSKKQLFIV